MSHEHDTRVLHAWAAGRLGSVRRGDPEVIFGQVREDAEIERAALRTVLTTGVTRPTVVAVGSGGCTGFSLLTVAEPERLTLVDINPAQTHLLNLKAALFRQCSSDDVLQAVDVDARSAYTLVQDDLPLETRAYWNPRLTRLDQGLNHCGLIDRRMATAMTVFHRLFQGPATTMSLLTAMTLEEQREVYQARWNRGLVRIAVRIGLSRLALRLVYGPEFVRLAPSGLGEIMLRQLEAVFLDIPARLNPYLWQAFLGRYPKEPEALPAYLRADNLPTVRAGLGRSEFVTADMAGHLEKRTAGSIHFFVLSNILEGMSEGYGRRLFQSVERTVAPGGIAMLRFLLPPPRNWEEWLPPGLTVNLTLSANLERQDRSLFCRFIRVIQRSNA